MKAGIFYLKSEKPGNYRKGFGITATILIAGLLSCLPSMAQTYYPVTALSGTTTIAGVDVTVTNVNGSSYNCGGISAPYWEGQGALTASYTWSFSTPVTAVRIHLDALDPGDDVSIMVNGSPYFVQTCNLTAYSPTCFATSTAIAGGGNILSSGPDAAAIIDINPGMPISSFSLQSLGGGNGVINDFNFTVDSLPAFVGSCQQSLSLCQDVVSFDISSLATVYDKSLINTLTWSQFSAPANGTLTASYSTTSNGSNNTPAGLSYSPNPGYSGSDAFTIQVQDNFGNTAYSSFTVSVNPTPSVDPVDSQVICNTSMTNMVTFTGSVTPTTFSWSGSNNTLSIPSNGTNTFGAYTVNNTTFGVVVDTITVTTMANGCAGMSTSFAVSVNPTPDVSPAIGNQAKCNNDSSDVVNFTGDVSPASYYWTNSANIGLATTGTGNIARQQLSNLTTSDIIDTVIVTPWANGCSGTMDSFTITVHPTPSVASAPNQAKCNGDTTNYVTFSGPVTPTDYFWSSSNTSLGIPPSGIDTIPNYTVTNGSNAPLIDTITITPVANGCPGLAAMMTITVNPTPMLSSTLTPDSICDSIQFVYYDTSNTVGITAISWVRDTLSTILEGSSFGTDSVKEYLFNTSNNPVPVTYVYTLLANSCLNTQSVVVVVKPQPRLSSTLTPHAICDSTLFTYYDTSLTSGISSITWERDTMAGIANPTMTGTDSVKEVLVNDTTVTIGVPYVYTLWANGCMNTQTVIDSVRPRPMLSTTLTPHSICNNDTFSYPQHSSTAGTMFSWSRGLLTGITPLTSSGTGDIHEALTNSTTNPLTVTYVDTLDYMGCINTENIMVAVNPTPRLSSSHKPTAICSGDIFNYTPTSATIGATYAWTRSYVPGIDLVAGGGTDNPDEQLINTTYDNVNVLYVYTVTINGCSFSPDSVTILVHPTPTLSSPLKATVCSGTPLVYTPSSYTPVPQVTYTWARAAVAGLTPSVGSGSGSITGTATTGKITETLTNSTTSTINTQYAIILKVDGVCPNLQTVAVAVNPAPAAPKIAIMPIDSSLCLNTNYQNFGAATAPPAGTTYIWSAINGQVWATSANKQNSIVTFDKSGTASVIVTSSIGSTACKNSDTVSYHVGTTSSDEPRVILFNGQFMCLENGMTSYQWGYDDATTLDSTAIQGEVNQVYFNNSPDLLHKYYWLMSTNNGCRQKTYYNLPTGITNVNAGELAGIKVYPNPANDNINVEINSGVGGDMQVEVLNLLGQKLNATVATDNKATISVAGLPAGCYLVNCYREGVKIGTAKFIKN